MWRQATNSEAHGLITNTMVTTCEPYGQAWISNSVEEKEHKNRKKAISGVMFPINLNEEAQHTHMIASPHLFSSDQPSLAPIDFGVSVTHFRFWKYNSVAATRMNTFG
jgi:hypothetical protein